MKLTNRSGWPMPLKDAARRTYQDPPVLILAHEEYIVIRSIVIDGDIDDYDEVTLVEASGRMLVGRCPGRLEISE
jgi:hypothetical protein